MEDRNLIAHFLQEVKESICPVLSREVKRFPTKDKLLKKYRDERIAWENGSNNCSDGITAIVNEMCFAKELLLMGNGKTYISIDYEKRIPNTAKTIDFFVQTNDKETYFDVKTVQPEERDDWKKYEEAKQGGYFPSNTDLVLDQEFQGGEIYHDFYRARERFLEYTQKFEEKIKPIPHHDQYIFKMVFCGDGKWYQSHLEDFADFYRTSQHRPDDNFAEMETDDMKKKNITLSRMIGGFVYLERRKSCVDLSKFELDVHGADFPYFVKD